MLVNVNLGQWVIAIAGFPPPPLVQVRGKGGTRREGRQLRPAPLEQSAVLQL